MAFVYFDHNATTPLDERVLAVMLPALWLLRRPAAPAVTGRHRQVGTLVP